MPIFNNILAGAGGATGGFAEYEIERSIRFNSGDSAYIQRNFASGGNRKTWTLSFWVKFNGSTGHLISAGNDAFQIEMRSDGQYLIQNSGCFSNTYSTAVFRDYSAWQHFVIEHDATNTYCKIHVNGSLQKTITVSNGDGAFNNNTAHNFNGRSTSLDSFTDFLLGEVNFVDGSALNATSFGQTDANGVWQAKDTSGLSFGTNGFRLKFADNSGTTATTLGKDTSGNSNNWTPYNLSVASGAGNDSLADSPTNNYGTLNPLSKSSQTNIVLANGNLEASNTSSSGQGRVHGTIAISSGKWYFEATVTGSSSFHEVGIIKTTENLSYGIGYFAGGYSYIQDGSKYNNNSTPSYGASYSTGDTIGVAFDADNGTLVFYKNGASQGTAYSSLSGTYYPAVSTYSSGANFGWTVNFGQREFVYQNAGTNRPSADYKSLNTTNLANTTVTTSGTYTGNSNADGPFVYLNGIPTAMSIGGSAVTFGTGIDKLSNGFKIRSGTANNTSGTTYSYAVTTAGDPYKTSRAQIN